MAIGTYRCTVINVDDLEIGYEFWSAVTGLEVIGPPFGWHGRFGYLGQKDPWRHDFILQVTDVRKDERVNRVHIDLSPNEGMERAIQDILALGGSVRKHPSLYPRPGSHGDEPPVIDWAVMCDPFGNEFCLVSDLTEQEIASVLEATRAGALSDHEWRIAAGLTS